MNACAYTGNVQAGFVGFQPICFAYRAVKRTQIMLVAINPLCIFSPIADCPRDVAVRGAGSPPA